MNKLSEEQLKKEAKKRVDFKYHLLIYVLVTVILWTIWQISGGGYGWPVWPTTGWGIAIVFHYMDTFNSFQIYSVEKEIEKLKKKEK